MKTITHTCVVCRKETETFITKNLAESGAPIPIPSGWGVYNSWMQDQSTGIVRWINLPICSKECMEQFTSAPSNFSAVDYWNVRTNEGVTA